MKKWMILLVVFVMLFSFAMAETSTVQTVNFLELVPAETVEKGNFIDLTEMAGVPVSVWIPGEGFAEAEASESIPGEFLRIVYLEGSGQGAISFTVSEPEKSHEEVLDNLKAQDSVSDITDSIVNGIPCITCITEHNGIKMAIAAYDVSENKWLTITIVYTDNTDFDFMEYASLICMSLTPNDDSEG